MTQHADAELLAVVAVLNSRTLHRAKRVTAAIQLLRAGVTKSNARALILARFSCDQAEAWRVVDMASDMAAPVVEVQR